MALQWRYTDDAIDWTELSALYRAAPLGDKPPALLQPVFGNSRYKCVAFDDGQLVGAGRALADGHDCSYICDIAVLPSLQGTGLGQQIVAWLVEQSRGHKKIILYSVPGKEAFYKRFGFLRMNTAMAIFHDEARARERGYVSDT